MVRSTCLAVDAGLPDVLQTPPGWRKGPGPGGAVPGLRPRRALPCAGLPTDAPKNARPVRWPNPRSG